MTTPAGTIGIGLSIDGSDIGSKIAEAVQRHLRPVLADIEHLLDRVQREYKDTAREAEKSSAAQAAGAKVVQDAMEKTSRQYGSTAAAAQASAAVQRSAAKRVKDAQDELNAAIDVFGKKSPQAAMAAKRLERAAASHTAELLRQAAASRASTNSQVNDYERLARAAELAAARQAAAAAVANAAQGGGSPPGGGFGGGFGGGRGGGARSLLVPGIANAAALIIGSFPTAALAVTNLTGAIQQLAQGGLVLPGVLGGIVTSLGTAKLGFVGLSDAISSVWEAAASGDPAELTTALDELNKSEKLAEEVKQLARAAGELYPVFERVQKSVAGNMFRGVAEGGTQLINRVLPTLERGLDATSKAWNNTFTELLRVGGSDSSISFLDKIFGNTAEAQNRANAAIEPLMHAIGTLTAEGSDFLPRIADALTGVMTRFDNWVTRSVENGNLDKWIDQGLTGIANLGNTFLDLGKIITSITKAAGGDGGLLQTMADGTAKLSEFLASAEGQDKLVTFFTEAREQAGKWLDVGRELMPVLKGVYDAAKAWTDMMLPVIERILAAINAMPGGVEAVVTAFLAWTTIRGVTSLLGMLTGIGGALGSLPGKATGAAGGINAALSKIAIPAALGGLLAGFTSDMIGPNNSTGSNLGGAGLNIAGGAAIGASVAGVPGAIAGALAGVATSIYQRVKADLDEGRRQWEAQWDAKHGPNADPNRPGSQAGQLAAVPALRGQLQPSLYNPDGTLKNTLGQEAAAKIAAGQLQGWTIGPNGQILGPGGVPMPGMVTKPLTPAQVNPAVPPSYLPQPPKPVMGPQINEGQLPKVAQQVEDIATSITKLPEGEVRIKDPSPEVIENLEQVDAKITKVSENEISVKADTEDAQRKVDALIRKYESQIIRIRLQPSAAPLPPVAPPRAGGGMVPFAGLLPGYSPGIDNMLVPLGGGEGVVIPEAMRALGPRWLYNINSRFRAGLPRSNYGFADGGVFGAGGLPGDDPVIKLLTEIRDALVGRTGGPLSETADALAGTTAVHGERPFGGDVGKGALAGMVEALGGDASQLFPGFNAQGQRLVPTGMSGGGVLAPADYSGIAAALAKFATSGDTAALGGTGLGINDPVVTAITAARNKRKGGLSDDQIAGLITQVLGGGGFSGTLDESNTPLVKALTRYQEKLAKGAGVATVPTAGGGMPGLAGMPAASGNAMAMMQLAMSSSGGRYQWGGSDLAAGLSDCSGAVSDLVEILTTGKATPDRLFDTTSAAGVLQSLGAQKGLVPGALQIGFSPTHMAATLPNGVNFESGGATGQGATYGGNAAGAGDPQFTEQWSLPVGNLAGMFGDQMAGMANDMCGCVNTGMADGLKTVTGGLFDGLTDAGTNLIGAVTDATLTGPPKGPTVQGPGDNAVTQLANLLGFKVSDGTIQGGGAAAQNLLRNTGPGSDATGRVYSDTAALIDRSFTSMETAAKARHQQQMDVLNQVRDLLTERVLKPTLEAGFQAGMNGLSSGIQSSIGQNMGGAAGPAMGQTAGPIIASAVRAAIPMAPTHDSGGDWPTGTYGLNMSGGTEKVLTPAQARLFDAGLLGGWNLQPQQQHLAGNVGSGNANATVGADFFGVSQVPIIGTIVNMLVQLLLAIIGVNIELENTLTDMTKEIRGFRGDFQAFDATGRLASDTAALTARTQTDREMAEQRRMRILKDVIIGAVKFVIEKLIMPIIQAVVNSLIQAAGQAINGAISGAANVFAPGSGAVAGPAASIVTSIFTGVATAVSNVIIEVVTLVLTNGLGILIENIGDLITGLFPNLLNTISGGLANFGKMLTAVFTGILQPFISLGRMITGFFGGLGLPSLFDSGGEGTGIGLMPKNVLEPERVLSPSQTRSFNRLIEMIDSGKVKIGGENGRGSSSVVIHAPFTVSGGESGARSARDHLLELIPG